MKAIIIGVTAAIGLLGGAVSMVGSDKPEEGIQGYTNQPVQYLEFTEPMEITGRVQHIVFTENEATEAWGNVK